MTDIIQIQNQKEESPTWYNRVSAEAIDRWRVIPRLLMVLYGIQFYMVTSWFMSLDDPTNAQAAFVSTITASGAAWFGLYVGGKPSSQSPSRKK